jgi:hypothetical protein
MTTISGNGPLEPHGGPTPRHKAGSWMFFRIVIGVVGAALVIFPITSGNGYVFSVAGLVVFVAAILFSPAKPKVTLEEKARELGALTFVDGGRYRLPDSSSSVPVQLFVCADRICGLDGRLRPLVEIPAGEITSFLAIETEKGWFLEVIWSAHAAEFYYRGVSAERLAHVAENAIRKVAPTPAPFAPQSRAASA